MLNRNDRPLAGKAAVVTGASRRIGRAVALGLAQAGADVLVAGSATFKGGPDRYADNIAALKGGR